MTIAWTEFTPWTALIGGSLIGLAAAGLLLLNGRIAGISGILAGCLRPVRGDTLWRLAFLVGLMATPALWLLFSTLPPIQIDADYPTLVFAGLLVGLGTRYGSGCTSGHGGLRAVQVVAEIPGRHPHLHGGRIRHGLSHSSFAGGLKPWPTRSHHCWPDSCSVWAC